MEAPKDPLNPRNKDWALYDVRNRNHPRPPIGVNLLVINPGGVLILGRIDSWVRYWTFKPDIPEEPAPEDLI